jgi:hypothetical protein
VVRLRGFWGCLGRVGGSGFWEGILGGGLGVLGGGVGVRALGRRGGGVEPQPRPRQPPARAGARPRAHPVHTQRRGESSSTHALHIAVLGALTLWPGSRGGRGRPGGQGGRAVKVKGGGGELPAGPPKPKPDSARPFWSREPPSGPTRGRGAAAATAARLLQWEAWAGQQALPAGLRCWLACAAGPRSAPPDPHPPPPLTLVEHHAVPPDRVARRAAALAAAAVGVRGQRLKGGDHEVVLRQLGGVLYPVLAVVPFWSKGVAGVEGGPVGTTAGVAGRGGRGGRGGWVLRVWAAG